MKSASCFLALLLAVAVTDVAVSPCFAIEAAAPAAPSKTIPSPTVSICHSQPLFAGLFHEIVGNRSRIMQAAFVCICIGIFILWKK